MRKLYAILIKRMIDFITAVILLLLLLPVFFTLMAALYFTGHNRIFFIQKRVGKGDKIFSLIKFISMTNDCDEEGNLLPDHKRLTKFGKWLRSSSLDELPQLINVFCGDMSLIGPRPLLVDYLPLYNAEQKKRHLVRPGITGWAQVNGRNAIGWEQKFDLDVWYVRHVSFLLDCKIVFLTMLRVFKKQGISQEGEATVVPFRGTKNQIDL